MPIETSPDRLGYVPMADAPGADINFDDLFPPEGFQAEPQAHVEQTPPQQPQAPSNEPFLKAGESVYLTAEDAAKGVQHKDELINRYRTFLKDSGVDPNTFQRTAPEPQAQQPKPQEQQSPYQYYGNGKKFYESVAKAVDSRNPDEFERIQREYTREAINAELAAYVPIMGEVTRQRAVRQVSQEIPDFNNFINSEDFRKVQDKLPSLKQAIQLAETNPQAADYLREYFQMAYFINKGINAGSTQPQAAPQPVAPATPPTVRPTLTQSNLTPPSPTTSPNVDWTRMNQQELRQFIKDREARVADIDWSKVGL